MPSTECKQCRIPKCGDGIIDPELGEECDEGSAMPSGTCKECKVPSCGDGRIDPELGETCEPRDPSYPVDGMGACREDCTYCGDGKRDEGEECDDGGNMPSRFCKQCKVGCEA